MIENNIEKVSEDIQLIKDVIERTSRSITYLNNTFIQLGFLFLTSTVLLLLSNLVDLDNHMNTFIIISILWSLLIVIGVIKIFQKAFNSKIIGLSKQLLKIWVFIFMFIALSTYFNNNLMLKSTFNLPTPDNAYISTSFQLIGLSFGFLCMRIFSKYKIFGLFSIIYLILGIFFFMPNPLTSSHFIESNSNYFQLTKLFIHIKNFLLPVTFLITGYYLKIKQTRRE